MKIALPNIRAMKKIIPIIGIAAVMTACNSKPDTMTLDANRIEAQQPASNLTAEDSLVLTQFRAWKAENELKDAREFLNGGESQNTAVASNNRSTSSSAVRRSSGTSTNRTVYSNTSTQAAKKKGWSSAAKGAVIGGVAGAAGGAVINKRNRAVGAVVGGILGAGVGYGIGRSKDVKNGRN